MFQDVCRLCSCTQDLLWVFDKRLADNMAEIIDVTSGIQISRTDTVSQMVCSTCCQVTIKMYQFRTKSIKNDKDLKARCAGYNVAQLANAAAKRSEAANIPPSVSPSIPPAPVVAAPVAANAAVPFTNLPIVIRRNPPQTPIHQRYRFAHPSIKAIVKKYPTLVLPDSCLKSHVDAYITLVTNEVDDYYREKNLSETEIANIRKEAYELANPPNKKTTPSGKKRRKSSQENTKTSAGSSAKKSKLNNGETGPKRCGRKREYHFIAKSFSDYVKQDPVPPTSAKTVSTSNSSSGNNGVFLNGLLCDTGSNKAEKKREDTIKKELTLKSMLKTSEKPAVRIVPIANSNDDDDDIIDVEGPVSPIHTLSDSEEEEVIKPKRNSRRVEDTPFTTLTDEETDFFSCRPFLHNKEPINENSQDGSKNPNENNADNNSDCDTIRFDLDSVDSNSTSMSTNSNEPDKISFVETLRLVPKVIDNASNQPDLSLVSLATKSHTLYTCKVCDSQHHSLKEMKTHEKRTHTKCPFCSKRFRTLANRDEHVQTCTVNRGPVELKDLKLHLKRVDEDEEIRKKYPNAFKVVVEEPTQKNDDQSAKEKESRVEESSKEKETRQDQIGKESLQDKSSTEKNPRQEKIGKESPQETSSTDKHPRQENIAKDSPQEKKGTDQNTEAKEPKQKTKQVEKKSVVIDLEKYDDTRVPKDGSLEKNFCDGTTVMAIQELEKYLNYAEVVPIIPQPQNNETDDVICISDEESSEATAESTEKTQEASRPKPSSPTTSKKPSELEINVVNSEILNNINLHDNDLNVIKSIVTHNKARQEVKKQLNQWNLTNKLIIDGNTAKAKIFKNLRRYLHQYKIPIEVKHSHRLSVQYQPRTPPPVKKITGLWSNQIPKKLKPLMPISPQANTVLNGQIGSGPQGRLKTNNTTTAKTTNPVYVQTNTASNAKNLILTSTAPTVTTSTPIVLNAACASSSSILLNGNVCNTSLQPSSYPILIIKNTFTATDTGNGSVTVTPSENGAASAKTATASVVETPPTVRLTAAKPPSANADAGTKPTTLTQQPPTNVETAKLTPEPPKNGDAATSNQQRPTNMGAATSNQQRPTILRAAILNQQRPRPANVVAATSNQQRPTNVAAISNQQRPTNVVAATSNQQRPTNVVAATSNQQRPTNVGAVESSTQSDGKGAAMEKGSGGGGGGTEHPSSSVVAQLESITQSLMPPVSEQTSSTAVVSVADLVDSVVNNLVDNSASRGQPAIRVRNLQELS